eukprot:Gregarina_sp_Pseudo_9__1385@NODE_1928_length_1247_cov_50_201987_g1788_i0_p1_GENE_NODE_1928_length_1247_cov_50_201987_g1788_i0NODE_1928_length_1247_cov_50_201987_g1788_i0_p1_ORF_typecomplete_len194_score37_97FH2/PF02181_23/9_5e16DUF615/PF04751_14/0_04DUF4407/PF14362_6/0_051WXG100/PF06013_12/0_18DUF3829/PF12889_7/0_2DUF3829/PF12889_7/1_3e03_NODE_1928_length_1247_cov_50_201987_g1788_i06641245
MLNVCLVAFLIVHIYGHVGLQLLFQQNPDLADLGGELAPLKDATRVELAAIEQRYTQFTGSFNKLSKATETLAASPSGGMAAQALTPFFSAAKGQLDSCGKMLQDVKSECTDVMKYFGETEQTMAKVPPQTFFRLVTSFAGGFEQERKTKLEKLERERKRLAKQKAKETSEALKAPAKGPPEKTPVKLRTAED